MKRIYIYILIISTCFAGASFAKSKNGDEASIKLLKELTDKGSIVRLDDVPVEKADTSEDTQRVRALKKLYLEDYNSIGGEQKNPDIMMNYRGTIE